MKKDKQRQILQSVYDTMVGMEGSTQVLVIPPQFLTDEFPQSVTGIIILPIGAADIEGKDWHQYANVLRGPLLLKKVLDNQILNTTIWDMQDYIRMALDKKLRTPEPAAPITAVAA